MAQVETKRRRKGATKGGNIVFDNDASANQLVPEFSLTPSPTPSFDETTSQYFSEQGANTMINRGSKLKQRIMKSLLDETPGPGYHSFSQHVMEVDAASTPVSQRLQVNTPGVSAKQTKLVFGKSPKSPNSPIASGMSVPTPKSAELRIKPGESRLLVQDVLQSTIGKPTPTKSKRKILQGTPTKSQLRLSPQMNFASGTLNQKTETSIVRRAEVGRPGLKEVKLRDDFEVLEFVDLILDAKTEKWDIVKDPTTDKFKVVAHQIFE